MPTTEPRRLRKPAEDQLHVADEDGGVEEADHEPKHHELCVALHEHLQHHADACARKPDQQHVARRHRPADRRPHHHADAVRQRKDALRETGLRGIEVEALARRRAVRPRRRTSRRRETSRRGWRASASFSATGLSDAGRLSEMDVQVHVSMVPHRFSRFACRRNWRERQAGGGRKLTSCSAALEPPPAGSGRLWMRSNNSFSDRVGATQNRLVAVSPDLLKMPWGSPWACGRGRRPWRRSPCRRARNRSARSAHRRTRPGEDECAAARRCRSEILHARPSKPPTAASACRSGPECSRRHCQSLRWRGDARRHVDHGGVLCCR